MHMTYLVDWRLTGTVHSEYSVPGTVLPYDSMHLQTSNYALLVLRSTLERS